MKDAFINRGKLIEQYKRQLSNIYRGVITVEGNPSTLLVDELMRNIELYGYAVIGHAYRNGVKLGLCVLDGAVVGGVTEYRDVPSFVTYSNPINDSRTYSYRQVDMSQECVIIRSSATYLKVSRIIEKYAILLADADITSDMTLISLRANNVLSGSANDSVQRRSISEFFKNLIEGKQSHIMSESILSSVQNIELNGNRNDMISCTTVKSNLMRSFYRDIGISMSKDKNQAILSDEVDSDIQALLVNQDSLITWIDKGLQEVSELFNIDKMTVSISKPYTVKKGDDISDLSI